MDRRVQDCYLENWKDAKMGQKKDFDLENQKESMREPMTDFDLMNLMMEHLTYWATLMFERFWRVHLKLMVDLMVGQKELTLAHL